MKYRLFLITATTVVLGSTLSCSQNEVVTNDGDQKDPISFNVNVGTLPAPDVTTRGYTTTSAETGYTFSGGEYMAVGLTHPSGSEVIKQYSVGAGSSGNNALTYQKESDGTTTGYTFDWLSTSETVTIRAWSDGKTTTAAPAVDPDGQPFTVETTQTGDVKELLYSPAASYAYTTSAINIPLYHQLARIVVTINRANTSTPISSVTIGHISTPVPITGTFTKPGAGVNYGTWSVADEITQPTHWDVITPKVETAGSVYSAVVIPGNATVYPADTRLFNITIGSEVFAYKIPTGGLTLEPGKQYNYTITVENMGITVTSNISDWVAADDYTHGDGLAISRSIKKNPLWWVAEYNMASNKISFVASHSTSSQYVFSQSDAMTANVSGYHLPTFDEHVSIIPSNSSTGVNPSSGTLENPVSYDEVACNVGGTSVAASTSWWGGFGSDWYAVRFIGTDYATAWHYKWVTSPCNGLLIESYQVLMPNETEAKEILKNLSSSPIFTGSYPAGTANQSPASITATNSGFTQRFLPACGYRGYNAGYGSGTTSYAQGTTGYYWSATAYNGTYSWLWRFGSTHQEEGLDEPKYGFSVRLFRDN